MTSDFELRYVRLSIWKEICEKLSSCPYNASYSVKRNYITDNKREREFLKAHGLELVYWAVGHGWRLRKDWKEKLERLTELKRQNYQPLRDLIDRCCRPGGGYIRPDNLTEEQLDERDDWYSIGLPDALVVYRLDDIPETPHYFSYFELMQEKMPVVVLQRVKGA